MTMMNEVNPPLDDVLAHHGVKGMRWGIRRNAQTGARPIAVSLNNSKFGKASERNAEAHNRRVAARPKAAVIRDARIVTASQHRQINQQIDKTNASSGAQQTKNAATLVKMNAAYLKSPDRATALRMTRGEKAALAALAVITAPSGFVPIGIGVGAGIRVHQRHQIERQQGTRK